MYLNPTLGAMNSSCNENSGWCENGAYIYYSIRFENNNFADMSGSLMRN